MAEAVRQVNVTSLGDDVRETLKVAGLEKAKERALQQHLRLRAPQTWTVLCASVDQYLRTTVDSSSPPTPMEIGAVMSTCACCGKAGHEKARCRFRNAKYSPFSPPFFSSPFLYSFFPMFFCFFSFSRCFPFFHTFFLFFPLFQFFPFYFAFFFTFLSFFVILFVFFPCRSTRL